MTYVICNDLNKKKNLEFKYLMIPINKYTQCGLFKFHE